MEIRLKNISLYYEETGRGRPLLMLHGWPLDHRSMKGAFEPLFADRPGWRRIYLDLPGMGRSGAPAWITGQDQVLNVLLEFIDAVLPGQRFCVAGLSYGGLLAQGLIHHIGDRIDGAVLLVPSMASATDADLAEFLVMHTEEVDYSGFSKEEIDSFKGMAVVQNQTHLQAWKDFIFPGVSAANFGFLEKLKEPYSFDVEKLERPFPAPVLFLLGRQDSVVGYRAALRLIENYPHASLAVLDCAGHCLSMEQTTVYNALANEWLKRVDEYTGQQPEAS
jgi:pimeloyl-ACP methyl ester carboxylesterase